MAENDPMPRPARLRVSIRRRRLLVDAGDLSDLLRVRARAYRRRADDLLEQTTDPARPVDRDGIVPALDEALACRMVAEELEQRADQLDALG